MFGQYVVKLNIQVSNNNNSDWNSRDRSIIFSVQSHLEAFVNVYIFYNHFWFWKSLSFHGNKEARGAQWKAITHLNLTKLVKWPWNRMESGLSRWSSAAREGGAPSAVPHSQPLTKRPIYFYNSERTSLPGTSSPDHPAITCFILVSTWMLNNRWI